MSVPGEWVLLAYRVPREPSTPRIAIWRRLKQLGVAQIGDGLVGLPADARTREQLEWVADDVVAASGTASVWLARPASAAAERELAAQMATARAVEYAKIAAEADASAQLTAPARAAAVRRLRAELRRVRRRDFFPPPEREVAQQALATLASEPVTDPVRGGAS
ncbi:Chromate resistance protein ChrB [Plantactinospora sp. DSM 117369]